MTEKPVFGLTPITPMPTARLDEISLDAIRQIVREEISKALADDTEEPEPADYKPRLITIESKPRLWVKFERDGVLYAGEVPAVEEKWGSE
jgi:hypothetical protein